MFSAFICCVLVTIGAAAPPTLSENDIKTEIVIVDDIAKIKHLIPDANLIPLQKDGLVKDKLRYTFGSRVSGDDLIAYGGDSAEWPTPQDITLRIKFPRSGTSRYVISYVEVLVAQSSNLGEGYVVAGGIGQRSITVVIEARNTLYFNFEVSIYGS